MGTVGDLMDIFFGRDIECLLVRARIPIGDLERERRFSDAGLTRE
jgi:hypothetical protein